MSKKVIWILVAVMSVAVFGLTLMQYYWIRNAVQVQEEQFDLLVNKALSDLVFRLEADESAKRINEEMALFDNTGSTPFIGEESKVNILRGKPRSALRNDSQTELLPDDSLPYPPTPINPEKLQPGSELSLGLKNTLQNNENIVEGVLRDMFFNRRTLREKIDKTTLSFAIENEFQEKGIQKKFEFAVKNQNDEMIVKSDNFQNDSTEQYYECLLFPNDVFAEPGYLSVYFPGKRNFLKPFGNMVISAVALIFIIVVIFSLTIYIIYRQKRLSEIKNDFINNMTHELKTPISTISLASQMLNDKNIPPEAKNMDYISHVIDDESKRLGYQVEKVLQMAVFDKGKISMKRKEIHVNELVAKVTNNFAIQVERKNGELTKKLQAKQDLLPGDEVHLSNVIFNLLDNAVKYSPESPKIEVRTSNTPLGINISVKDNGIGISKENQKKIFEQFFRVPTGNLHDVKGFGLGLSYVKKVVDQHKGKIKLSSELKKGTEFLIFLPFTTK